MKGIKLVKNSVIKLGRVRMRVRDIDYPESVKKHSHSVIDDRPEQSPQDVI
jgi:hypothetical protein